MKNNVVRLTESQLHSVIKESVRRLLGEAWGNSRDFEATAEINFEDVLNNVGINNEDERFKVYLDEFCKAFGGQYITIYGTLNVSFDDETLVDVSDCPEFDDALDECPSISYEDYKEIQDEFEDMVENLKEDNFEIDYSDYTPYEPD